MINVERWYTGGNEYYMTFKNGNHELRKITNEDTADYETVTCGHYQKCQAVMTDIMNSNIEYDHNL
ncbi:hypothetical protein D3C73_185920 [compost metagenome]